MCYHVSHNLILLILSCMEPVRVGAFSTSDCFNSWQKIRQEFEIWLLSILEPAKNTMTFQRLPSKALYRHWSILCLCSWRPANGMRGQLGPSQGFCYLLMLPPVSAQFTSLCSRFPSMAGLAAERSRCRLSFRWSSSGTTPAGAWLSLPP